MNILRYGSRGPQVQLLQLALNRAGFPAGATDGIFGAATQTALRNFQVANGLAADGVAGARTHAALEPWYTGYRVHTVRPGDTLYRLAGTSGSTVRAIEIANPGIDPMNLRTGSSIVVPFGFPVVPTTIDYGSELIRYCCRGLAARYPFICLGELGKSVMGKPLYTLTLGSGENRVFYNASHHANEWITTPVLLRWCEELARAFAFGGSVYGQNAGQLLEIASVCLAPAVNPDGIDLVTGDLTGGAYYSGAQAIAADYPVVPFPSGWKANILGTDLNLQYPAGWSRAREIKFAQGYISPAPRDFVGTAPLSAPESRAVYDFTLQYSPSLTLSYHTQGNIIYWKYLDFEPEGSRAIAYRFAQSSGYEVEETPYASGFAGYKDWFIQDFNRPGYTIEVGLGVNPLPMTQFEEIYAANVGILTIGLTATARM